PLRVAASRRRRARNANCSRSTWYRGSDASLPTSNGRKPPTSIATSARSAACSSKSIQKPLRYPDNGEREKTEEEIAMQSKGKTTVGRREFLRVLGAGASVAAAAPLAMQAKADTENNDEKRKARYKETDHVKTFYRVNRYPS